MGTLGGVSSEQWTHSTPCCLQEPATFRPALPMQCLALNDDFQTQPHAICRSQCSLMKENIYLIRAGLHALLAWWGAWQHTDRHDAGGTEVLRLDQQASGKETHTGHGLSI